MRSSFLVGLPLLLILGCAPELARGTIADHQFSLVELVYLTGAGATDTQFVVVGSDRPGLCEALRQGTGRKGETTLVFTLAAFEASSATAAKPGTYTVSPTLDPALGKVALVSAAVADQSCSNSLPSWTSTGRGGTVKFDQSAKGLELDWELSVGTQNDLLAGKALAVPCAAPTMPTLAKCQ